MTTREYLLTGKGRELFSVVSAMLAWGERWLDDGDGELVEVHHVPCGHSVRAESECSSCGEPLDVADVDFRLGSGFPPELARRPDIRYQPTDWLWLCHCPCRSPRSRWAKVCAVTPATPLAWH
jgi:hypothetical protein